MWTVKTVMSNDLPVFKFSFIKFCPEDDSSIEQPTLLVAQGSNQPNTVMIPY
jgi:hypothetical protein